MGSFDTFQSAPLRKALTCPYPPRVSKSGGWTGRPRKRAREACFQRYGHTCWVCGHEGAYEVDHLDARGQGGTSYDLHNLRPAHGTHSPCPVCVSPSTGRHRCCNQERNAKPKPITATLSVDLHAL